MNRLINMVIRQIVNRLVRSGLDKGIDAMAKRKAGGETRTPGEAKAQAAQTKESVKRARQAMRVGRKIGKF
ncbi:hypothetical protein [Brevirhabdus sp.]|uniref:hypothetical protein n=1 Tax=Brevirhabdus sp. TaxID=2004514 RepID=UPI0040582FFF